jgi:poly-gamma-glutamate system protein
MKKIYWRPQGTSTRVLVLICAFSIGGFVSVEMLQRNVKQPYYQEKVAAARLASEAMEFLKKERLKRGLKIDTEFDPAGSGLIGSSMTPVTSDAGDLEAKQTSINPNFAAIIVELLKKVKAKEGDVVAVSFTGSLPALNVSVCAAIETLKLIPVIISSVGSSQWGANEPDFLWLDMEHLLYDQGIFPFRSVAASIGGKSDQGEEMSPRGRALLMKAIERNGLTPIRSTTIHENVDHRMKIYYKEAPPKLFINVGGGVISVGKRAYRKMLKPGAILSGSRATEKTNTVLYQFLKDDIPVIHLENVKEIARLYGLEIKPERIPAIGEGSIYFRKEYRPWLTGMILLGIIVVLYIFVQSDLGFRLFQATRTEEPGPPEPMV